MRFGFARRRRGRAGESTSRDRVEKGAAVQIEFQPVRLPKRTLTAAQAAKFAALREEIETELASRRAARVGDRVKPGLLHRARCRRRLLWAATAELPRAGYVRARRQATILDASARRRNKPGEGS
jgi:hypothetical protein